MRITESQLRRIIREEIGRTGIAKSGTSYGRPRRISEADDRYTKIVMDWYGEWEKSGGDFKKVKGSTESDLGNFNRFEDIKDILEKQGVLKNLSDKDLSQLQRVYGSAYDSKWG